MAAELELSPLPPPRTLRALLRPRKAEPAQLTPRFRLLIRRRLEETAPVEEVFLTTRTVASARHLAKLQWPDHVVLEVARG